MTINNGTKFISQGVANQQKHSLKYAVQCELPTLAWLILPSDLTMEESLGRWKQFSNMHMNGFRKNGGKMLETHTAQGFLRLSLNAIEAQTIIHCAKKAGRYLIPLEVSKILKREIAKTINEIEERRMAETWMEFCRKSDVDQRAGCTDPNVLALWFDYVKENYKEPLPDPSPWEN